MKRIFRKIGLASRTLHRGCAGQQMLKQVQHDGASLMTCRLAMAYGDFETGNKGRESGQGLVSGPV
ncbi:hypothetical protein [Gaoshiqia sp. Z1-71]|uniref:hypothetical protein n=1 Tax=Gaoshiqia hydrogeniformans TaxID=3290090 RepID=UPI003BF8F9E8